MVEAMLIDLKALLVEREDCDAGTVQKLREALAQGKTQYRTLRDVTEQKTAELALRASEARLRTVVSGAQIVLFALDQDRVFTMAEGRGLEALGVTSEYVVGSSMYAIMKNVDAFFAAVDRTLAGEEVVGLPTP